MNRRAIYHVLLGHAPLARVEIARMTRLAPSTVANGVAGLLAEGLVREIGAGRSSGGRKPILLDVAWNARRVIAVNISGGMIVATLVNLRLEIVGQSFVPVGKPERFIDSLIEAIHTLMCSADCTNVVGIALSVPGLLDREAGVIVRAVSYSLYQVPVKQVLTHHFGLPILIENDANAAAIGELCSGVARGIRTFAYVYVSNAVGAGLVVDGKLLFGATGGAGEFGHTSVAWDDELCACGGRGCLEQIVRLDRFLREMEREGGSLFPERSDDAGRLVCEMVRRRHGSPVVQRIASVLGAGLSSLINMIDPELVVLEGIYRDSPEFMQIVTREVHARQASLRDKPPPVVVGALGDAAQGAGAAVLMLQRQALWPQSLDVLPQGTRRLPAPRGGDAAAVSRPV